MKLLKSLITKLITSMLQAFSHLMSKLNLKLISESKYKHYRSSKLVSSSNLYSVSSKRPVFWRYGLQNLPLLGEDELEDFWLSFGAIICLLICARALPAADFMDSKDERES